MMEKGSFHTSPGTSLTRELDERVRNIPLPGQIPQGIDFTELPAQVLNSATLESLIAQNEDLMARLSVNLRKSGELESRMAHLESENKAIRTRFETLKEQYLVLQEKDRSSTTRVLQMHEESSLHKTNLKKLERTYASLFVQAQSFQKKMARLERYRAWVKKVVPSIQARSKVAKKLEYELVDFKAAQSALLNQSLSQYESQLKNAELIVAGLKSKAEERDHLLEQKTKLENQMIYEQRQAEQRAQEQAQCIEMVTQENTSLRIQIKELLVENESLRDEVSRFRSEIPHLQSERQRLTEQVESLQALWNRKQRELEQTEEKNHSLQKLNQQISINLNQQLKEIQRLETDLESERMTAQEKIKTLLAEIRMLKLQKDDGGTTKL